MPFSKNFIDNIRAAANIVEIVGEVVELKALSHATLQENRPLLWLEQSCPGKLAR